MQDKSPATTPEIASNEAPAAVDADDSGAAPAPASRTAALIGAIWIPLGFALAVVLHETTESLWQPILRNVVLMSAVFAADPVHKRWPSRWLPVTVAVLCALIFFAMFADGSDHRLHRFLGL